MKDKALPIEELRLIIDAFVEKVVVDPMIGFFFQSISAEVLKQREFELAASWMGHSIKYTGRPLRQAHAQHPIKGGHFDRRKTILKETLEAFNVEADIRKAWLDHTDALRAQITGDSEGVCDSVETSLDSLNKPGGPLDILSEKKGH